MIAMLANPVSPETEAERRDVQSAAQEFGIRLVLSDVFSARDIEAAFTTFVSVGQAGCRRYRPFWPPIKNRSSPSPRVMVSRRSIRCGIRLHGWPDELRNQHIRCLSPSRHLC